MSKAFEGMSVEAYAAEIDEWLETATHPTLGRRYLACAYAPMIELLRYLEANGFTTYIASGGDRDFMRPFADTLYGIPPERVIGSMIGVELDEDSDVTGLLYKSKIEFFDDGPQKPVRIWSRIGRRPLVAGGNSNGDIQMLRFARSASATGCACSCSTTTPSASSTTNPVRRRRSNVHAIDGWTVISMRDDWTRIFVDE